jgi:hypothetical protein
MMNATTYRQMVKNVSAQQIVRLEDLLKTMSKDDPAYIVINDAIRAFRTIQHHA